ncbi:unnamed protein product, partial [Ectocarpus sp. 13 AM-2016]
MDCAPDTPTAGYERYVSESESTDGEGDVSGGQRKSKVPATATAGFETAAAGEGERNNESHRHGRVSLASPASTASIFSRLAASWKKGSNSARGTRRTNGITHRRDNK